MKGLKKQKASSIGTSDLKSW